MSEQRATYQIDTREGTAELRQAIEGMGNYIRRAAAPPWEHTTTWADVIDEALCRAELSDLEYQAQDLLQDVLAGRRLPEELLKEAKK